MRTALHFGFNLSSLPAILCLPPEHSGARRALWRHIMEHEIEASPTYTPTAVKAEDDLCTCHFIYPLSSACLQNANKTEKNEQYIYIKFRFSSKSNSNISI